MTQPKDDVSGLSLLGKSRTEYPTEVSPAILETFPNRYPGRDYAVTFASNEFTSVCPMTGQPDYGRVTIEYIPDERCIESKSLKLYLFSYRNEPGFMETMTNRILDDLVAACRPRSMRVVGDFNARGGISIRVVAEYVKQER